MGAEITCEVTIRYEPSANSIVKKEDAQAVGEELAQIEGQHGDGVLADAVINAAKAKTSILHRYFEWDDHKAAHEGRQETARRLAASVIMVVPAESVGPADTGREGEVRVRAFISIREIPKATEGPEGVMPGEGPPVQAYRSVMRVLSSEEYRAEHIRSLVTYGRGRRRELELYPEVFGELLEVLEKLRAKWL